MNTNTEDWMKSCAGCLVLLWWAAVLIVAVHFVVKLW